jgi:hypothetical protein
MDTTSDARDPSPCCPGRFQDWVRRTAASHRCPRHVSAFGDVPPVVPCEGAGCLSRRRGTRWLGCSPGLRHRPRLRIKATDDLGSRCLLTLVGRVGWRTPDSDSTWEVSPRPRQEGPPPSRRAWRPPLVLSHAQLPSLPSETRVRPLAGTRGTSCAWWRVVSGWLPVMIQICAKVHLGLAFTLGPFERHRGIGGSSMPLGIAEAPPAAR